MKIYLMSFQLRIFFSHRKNLENSLFHGVEESQKLFKIFSGIVCSDMRET